MSEVKSIDLEPEEPEPVLPLEQQSSWWLGYYHEQGQHNAPAAGGKSYGDTLAERRKAKGMSQLELAEKVGTQQSTISRIEKGQMMPGVWLEKIEEALK